MISTKVKCQHCGKEEIIDAPLPPASQSTFNVKCGNCNEIFKHQIEDKGLRYNEGKLKWSLVHFKSLEPMVRVLMFGAKKYAPENWKKGLDKKEILESMQRHIAALMDGETHDPESGIHHMGHIQCNAMFYNFFEDKGNANT